MNVYKVAIRNQSGRLLKGNVVSATSPAVAVKRVMDDGCGLGQGPATVGPSPLKMKKHDLLIIEIRRDS